MAELGSSIIGVLSDTHDQVHHLVRVIDFFNRARVQMVIHCGDWVSPFTLVHYKKLQAPLYGVFGNNDGDRFRHVLYAQKLGLSITYEDQILVVSRWGKNMVVYHGDYLEIVTALIKCRDYDAVLYGHTHVPKVERADGVLAVNPGTLIDVTTNEIQGASIAVYDVAAHEARIIWLKDI